MILNEACKTDVQKLADLTERIKAAALTAISELSTSGFKWCYQVPYADEVAGAVMLAIDPAVSMARNL